MKLTTSIALLCTALISSQANAHSRWILPSHFTLSSDKGEWIALDITASNETFHVDKAMSVDNMRITLPNGKSERPSSVYKAHRKSVADYYVKDGGTYKITSNGSPSYFSSYELDGEKKRFRGNKQALLAAQPKATKVKTFYRFARIESYVTMNQPTENYALDGIALEVQPVTHPSEIIEGEPAQFQLLYNGKPQQGVKIEITKEGSRYRNAPETIELTSDKNGLVEVTLPSAGRFLFIAEYQQQAKNKQLADVEGGEVFLTIESQLN